MTSSDDSALAELLLAHVGVVAHDPHMREADWCRALIDGVDVPLADDLWRVPRGANCAAVVTRNYEYGELDSNRMKKVMRVPVLVDGWNVSADGLCPDGAIICRGVGREAGQ